jgi:hypothetical protein
MAAGLLISGMQPQPAGGPEALSGPAGCKVSIKAQNTSGKQISILLDESHVRLKTGTWSNLYFSGGNKQCGAKMIRLGPQAPYESQGCELDFDCDWPRRYRFRLHCVQENGTSAFLTVYYPSETAFTETPALDLGDVGRHFR